MQVNPKKKQASNMQKNGIRHTWFIDEIPKYRVEVPKMKSITTYLSEFSENEINLAHLMDDLRQMGVDDKITFILNSPGGLVSEGKTIINMAKSTGAFIKTELLAEAASMAAIIFCIGEQRVIYENSTLMFHNFTSGLYGKGHEIKERLKHVSFNFELFFKSNAIGLTDKEIVKMMEGKDYWFDAKEMCQRGIATHVVVENIMIPASQYLKLLKKAKKQAKNYKVEIDSLSEALLYDIDVLTPFYEKQQAELNKINETIVNLVTSNELLYN
jgi:ATP-dependent Clp protease protease subunit